MRAAPSNLSLSFLRKAAPAAARLAAVADDLPEILIPFLSISILFLSVLLFIIFVLILFVGISTSAPSSQSSRRRSSVSRSCTMTSSPMASYLSVSPPPLLAVASPSPSETSRSHLAVPCPSQSPSDFSVPMLSPSPVPEVVTDACYFTAIEPCSDTIYICDETFGKPTEHNVKDLFEGLLVGQAVRFVNSSTFVYTVSVPRKGIVLVHRFPIPGRVAECIADNQVLEQITESFYAIGKQVSIPVCDRQSLYHLSSESLQINEEKKQLEKNISWADSGLFMSITNSDAVDTDSDMSKFATDLCYFTAIEVHLNSGYRSCEEALILPAPENVNALFAGNLVGQVVRYVDSSRYIFTVSMPGKGLVLVHRYPVFEATSISNDPVINWIVASFYAMVKQVMLPPSYYCSASVEVNEENNISWADSGMYMSITHSDTISDISCADSGMLNADPEITCCMSNTDPDISCASSCMSNTDPDISCCMSNTDPDISCASSCMSDGSESDMSMGQKEVQKKKTKKVLVEKEEGKKKAVAHAPRRSPRLAEKKMQVKDADVSKDISKNRKKSRPVEEARPERRSPRLAEKAKGTGK